MQELVKLFFTLLEVLFFAGLIGSALVVILTSIEDARELGGDKEPAPTPAVTRINMQEQPSGQRP